MPTIIELFQNQNSYKYGTNYSEVKSDTETLIEQETTGLRVKSLVELNNPLLYGNESVRIANRSTKTVEDMKNSIGGESPDGGLIGLGISKLTAGRLNSISDVRNYTNDKLGIPSNPIPTYVDGTGELQKGTEPNTMITLAKIRKDASGTELGKFLKQTGGGNFRTIGRNIVGQGISLVKDKLRDTLFGSPAGLGENEPTNGSYEYSSVNPYSSTISIAKNTEPNEDKLQLLQTQAKEKVDELKSKTADILKKTKKVDEKVEDKSTDDSETYSLRNQTFTVKDSTETNLSVPSAESDDEKKQDTLNDLTAKKPLGEKQEDKEISDENKYSDIIRQEQVDDREEGTFSRIDLTKIPGNNADRTPKLFRTIGGPSELGIQQNNSYDDEVAYTSTVGRSSHDQKGLTSNKGDLINSTGFPVNGEYKDGDVTYTKQELEALDLVPLWISGLDSSAPVFFRTIITGLTETVSPSWSGGKFVGNPYNYYTYDGVERSVTFNLNLYCMNQYELMKCWERVTYLTSKAYPSIKDNIVNPPFIRFRLGDIYKNKTGFIESLSYTMPDNGNWETELDGSLLPKYVDVSMTIKFVEVPGSEYALYGYDKSVAAKQQIKEDLNSESEESVSGAPVTNGAGGGGEQSPIVIDNAGQVTDKAPEEPNSSQGSSKGVTNINTGQKDSTPQMANDETIDGVRTVSFTSDADSTAEERYKAIRKVINDRDGALKLSRRYSSKSLSLISIDKENEKVYKVKEESQKMGERIYAYKQVTYYGGMGKQVFWTLEKWDKYLKAQGKESDSNAFMSSDLPGGGY